MQNDGKAAEKKSLQALRRSLTRREWAQRMLTGAGAGLAVPALAEAHWADAAVPVDAQAGAEAKAAPDWSPAFFDNPQNQTVLALAERIVPGSTAARANRFLDTALGVSAEESQKKFVASLNALEGEALRQFTKSFKELSADQQDSVLTAASAAPSSHPDLGNAAAREEIAHAAKAAAPSLRDYFEHLKGWISTAYYSSEVGMKELGWTGENFFESLPDCQHPADHS